jgi:hypothetical protein
MNWQLLQRVPALVLLAGGIVLLQSHSMEFWSEQTGSDWLSPVWSLVIELGAIWLWARGKTLVACIATMLALGAPLFDLAEPHYSQWQTAKAEAAANQYQIAQLRTDLTRLEAKQATYLKNSQRREGWAGLIEKTESQITAARTELNHAESQTAPALELAAAYQVGIQILALILVQALVVLTTRAVFAPLPATAPATDITNTVGGDLSPNIQQQTTESAPAVETHGAGRSLGSNPIGTNLDKEPANPKIAAAAQRLTASAS